MPLRDGLVYLWELDESTGTRADAMGNMDLSTITGTPTNQLGVIANALSIDGSSTVSRSGVVAAFAGASVINFSVWVYPTSIGSTQQAILTQTTTVSGISVSWRFNSTTGQMVFSLVDDNGTTRQVNSAGPGNDTWTHFFIRFVRSDGLYAYRNMAAPSIGAVGDFPYTTSLTGQSTMIGGRSSTDRFIGRIDQMAIWTRDLSVQEREALYNHGAGTDLLAPGLTKPLHSYSHRWGMLQTGAKLANALPVSALYTNRKAIFQAAALVSQSVPWYTELRRRVLVLGAGAVHELGGLPAARLRRSIWRT